MWKNARSRDIHRFPNPAITTDWITSIKVTKDFALKTKFLLSLNELYLKHHRFGVRLWNLDRPKVSEIANNSEFQRYSKSIFAKFICWTTSLRVQIRSLHFVEASDGLPLFFLWHCSVYRSNKAENFFNHSSCHNCQVTFINVSISYHFQSLGSHQLSVSRWNLVRVNMDERGIERKDVRLSKFSILSITADGNLRSKLHSRFFSASSRIWKNIQFVSKLDIALAKRTTRNSVTFHFRNPDSLSKLMQLPPGWIASKPQSQFFSPLLHVGWFSN